MAKKNQEPKPNQAKKVLTKRVNLVKGGKGLGRDVKAPKWLRAIGAYVIGAVHELKEVHWPNRRTTWGFTLAVIVFTVAMSAFILALDYGFEQLFKQVILS